MRNRTSRLLNIFLFLLFTLVFLELLSRSGYLLFPHEEHQRYGAASDLKFNGRGAIGNLFKGQNTTVAFFGGSSLFSGVPMTKNYPQLLKKYSKNQIHVDNFAFYVESWETLDKKLDVFCKRKYSYDLLVLQLSHLFKSEDIFYHHRYKPTLFKLFEIYEQIKSSLPPPFFLHKYFILEYPEDLIILKEIKQNKTLFFNYSLEQKELKKRIEKVSFLIPKILNNVFCISKQFLWITEPFLNPDTMLELYKEVYISYYISSFFAAKKHAKEIEYLDIKYQNHEKTLKKIFRQSNSNIVIIDLFKFFNHEISKTNNLFIDPVHLSARGHELAFYYTLPYFKKYLPIQRQ